MRTLYLLALLLITSSSFSQDYETYRLKKNPGKVTITPYINSDVVLLRVSGLFLNARKVVYLDTINGYQAVVPKTMEMQETNNLYNFCSLIPREDGRDNAICINSAPKADYKSLKNFKRHIIEDSKYYGENQQKWLWGENSRLISYTREVFEKYDSYKAYIQVNESNLR